MITTRTPLCNGFESPLGLSRRKALQSFGMGLGSLALADLLAAEENARSAQAAAPPAKAKRVIFLFQAGGPSQIDLYDWKPQLKADQGKELPASIRMGQRLTAMSGNQASLPLVGTPFKMEQHGDSGAWINSDTLPHIAGIADELCFIKSMHTEAINHGPGVTFMQTGSQFPGRPSMGAWLDFGLGSLNQDLPSFVVMVTKNKGGQPLVSRLWGSGFLPGKHDGVRFRADKDAILYLNSPPGIDRPNRRKVLNHLRELHEMQLEQTGDPALETRIAQYEMAFNMQQSIPEVTDLSDEPESTFKLYGNDAKKPGSFAANCLLARRLAERDVRFIQLYHQGWDQHGGLPGGIRNQCRETDQASAALVTDLKNRGLLEDTLVIWGGEFGRTSYCQGRFNSGNFGRDHHGRCFTVWMAGGGCKAGTTYGATDEYSYNIAENPVHIHDFHATILHLLGIDHERLTYKYQGRHFRLTDVHGKVIRNALA
ncbi:MAG: sulfatase [Verrucomicrobiaceae bacterium]|nr:sulfatase [Verrucomicrobiaceae bacterium]